MFCIVIGWHGPEKIYVSACVVGSSSLIFSQSFLSSGRVVGAEVLLRWTHPGLVMLTPAKYLDIIVERGLVDDVFFGLMHKSLTLHRYCAASA